MAFSEAEKERWRAGRDQDFGATERPVCGHCGNAFAPGAGVVAEDLPICDVCNCD